MSSFPFLPAPGPGGPIGSPPPPGQLPPPNPTSSVARTAIGGLTRGLFGYFKKQASQPTTPPEPHPRGFGLRHPDTFAALYNSLGKAYLAWQGEAKKNSQADAEAMLNDAFVTGLLFQRWMPTLGLPLTVKVEDPDDPEQAEYRDKIQAALDEYPCENNLRYSLLWATWFGKAGAHIAWDRVERGQKSVVTVVDHLPLNGDKIIWFWDGTPGVLVRAVADHPEGLEIALTNRGRAAKLSTDYWRRRFAIHRHLPRDTDFQWGGEQAESIYGFGIRDQIYWTWWLRQELLSWSMDGLQRYATNGQIVGFYDTGNDQMRAEMMDALLSVVRDNVACMPRNPDDKGPRFERFEIGTTAYDVLLQFINHLEEIIKVALVGQELTSGTAPTGLGSGVADQHRTTFEELTRIDAKALGETYTEDIVKPLCRYNFGELPFRVWAEFQQETDEFQEKLAAATGLAAIGVQVDGDELRDMAGLSAPKAGDLATRQPAGGSPGQPGLPSPKPNAPKPPERA